MWRGFWGVIKVIRIQAGHWDTETFVLVLFAHIVPAASAFSLSMDRGETFDLHLAGFVYWAEAGLFFVVVAKLSRTITSQILELSIYRPTKLEWVAANRRQG